MPTRRFQPLKSKGSTPDQAYAEISNVIDSIVPLEQYPLQINTPVNASAGQFLRLAPRATGQEVVLPAAGPANFGLCVSLFVKNSKGILRVRAATGTVNGETAITFGVDTTAIIILTSDGENSWATSATGIPVGSITPPMLVNGVLVLSGAGPFNDVALTDDIDTILCDASCTITGFADGWRGRALDIHMGQGALTLTLLFNSGLSLTGNKLATPDGNDFVQLRGGARLRYDTNLTDVWRVVATATSADRITGSAATSSVVATSAGGVTATATTTIDLTAPSTRIDSAGSAGGFLAIKESAASTPSVSAGYGLFWVLNEAPSVPMFTGDTNVDLRILTEGNVDQSIGHIGLDANHKLIYRKSRAREFWHEEFTYSASVSGGSAVTTSGVQIHGQCTNWWAVTFSGSGTQVPLASINNHMGILRLQTGAAINNDINMYNGVANTIGFDTYRGDEIYMAEAIIRLPVVSSILWEFGFRDAAGANYIEFYGDTAVGTTVHAYTEEASATEDTDTGVTFSANAWNVYTILQETLGTVDFYIDDVLEATEPTDIPDSETMCLFFRLQAKVADAVTPGRQMDIDYVSFESQGMGTRTS